MAHSWSFHQSLTVLSSLNTDYAISLHGNNLLFKKLQCGTHQQQMFCGPLSRITRVSQYQKYRIVLLIQYPMGEPVPEEAFSQSHLS